MHREEVGLAREKAFACYATARCLAGLVVYMCVKPVVGKSI